VPVIRSAHGLTTEKEAPVKAIRIHAPGHATVDEIAEPTLRAGTVKVEIAAAGICGTDLHLYQHAPIPDDLRHVAFGETGPHVLGHEMAGHVVAMADDVDGLSVGELVAVRPLVIDGTCDACLRGEQNLCRTRGILGIHGGGGAFSEFVVTPAEQIHPLPFPFTAETGALVESLATSWHAARSVSPAADDVAVIVGAGPIGLGLLLTLRAMGVDTVLVSEPSPRRRELATALGGTCVDPFDGELAAFITGMSEARGADYVFDAAGIGGAMVDEELAVLRNGGTLVVVSDISRPVTVNLSELMRTGKRICGSAAYTAADFNAVVDAVAGGRLDPTPLITLRIGLEHTVSAGLDYLLRDGRENEVKIIVTAAGQP
jgi:2-desacetyl-2-hydroxyethyl bacteriochlorophyllide A dehydrogenase